jgi:hypothetical protein
MEVAVVARGFLEEDRQDCNHLALDAHPRWTHAGRTRNRMVFRRDPKKDGQRPPFGRLSMACVAAAVAVADLFLEVSRRYWKPEEFIVGNFKTVGWESVVLLPIVAVAWWTRRRPSAKAGH